MTASQKDPSSTRSGEAGENRTLVLVGFVAIFVATVLRLGWPQEEFLAGTSLALQLGGTLALAVHITSYIRRRVQSRR
jgi:hypothetical protein